MTSTDLKTSPISIVIPTRNEALHIAATIASAQTEGVLEILVVDGGSTDKTVDIAREAGVRVIAADLGRAVQMNMGAAIAQGEILLFLHGDTLLPPEFARRVVETLRRPGIVAGAFALAIDLPGPAVRLVEKMANFRSSCLRMPYGDQAIFLYRRQFIESGGYPEEPILEDVLLIQHLKKSGRIGIVPSPVLTSGRRWQGLGVLKTTLINQGIMLGHLAGLSPQRLHGWYGIAKKIRNGGLLGQ